MSSLIFDVFGLIIACTASYSFRRPTSLYMFVLVHVAPVSPPAVDGHSSDKANTDFKTMRMRSTRIAMTIFKLLTPTLSAEDVEEVLRRACGEDMSAAFMAAADNPEDEYMDQVATL